MSEEAPARVSELNRAVAKLDRNHAQVLDALMWWIKGFEAACGDRPHSNLPWLAGIHDLSGIIREIIERRDQ